MGKICLAMVVANERPVIERCLDSVSNLIDQVCISINGDEDGTLKCIEEWGERNQIPITVWFDPWNGYGPNKTRNLLKVRTELETEYILFLDADEVFVTDPENPLSYPTKQEAEKLVVELDAKPKTDVFYMNTYYGEYIYNRWQVIRNNQVWIWHLPYQELLTGEKSNNRSDITWLYNYSRHDGHSSRHPDLSNNLKLLENWLEENPDADHHARALFYLGQGYKNSGNASKAIEYLEKRLEMGGWFQERYISALYLAQLYKDKNSKNRRKYLLECIDIDPRRLEAFYELMCDDFSAKKYRQAVAWAVMAPNTRNLTPGAFLINKNLYKYKYDYQLSIIAYYAAIKRKSGDFVDTGIFQIGLDAINRCMDNLPLTEKKLTISNTRFYTENLPTQNPTTTSSGHDNTTAIIIDDFYPDPRQVRSLALKMPFEVRGNYPGVRTEPYIPDGMKERIERLIGAKITYWPDQYNGSFQYTTEDHTSWIHRDNTEWSLVVYLTPDAPVDGGTKLYLHKATGLTKTDDPETEKLFNKDSHDHDAWHTLDKVGNRFNRAILFKGRNSHMSDQYFGTCLEDGRLFQTFFFNTASFNKPKPITTKQGMTSIVTIDKGKNTVTKKVTQYTSYSVFEREIYWLNYFNEHEYKWCPKLTSTDPEEKTITMEYVGEPITKHNAPKDWKQQLEQILEILDKDNIEHNDIKNTEILIRDGVVHLIDYGWMSKDSDWSCKNMLSGKAKPSEIFPDQTAITRIEESIA